MIQISLPPQDQEAIKEFTQKVEDMRVWAKENPEKANRLSNFFGRLKERTKDEKIECFEHVKKEKK